MKEFETLIITNIFVELKLPAVLDEKLVFQKELAELLELCSSVTIQNTVTQKD